METKKHSETELAIPQPPIIISMDEQKRTIKNIEDILTYYQGKLVIEQEILADMQSKGLKSNSEVVQLNEQIMSEPMEK